MIAANVGGNSIYNAHEVKMRSVGESRDPDGWGQVGNLQLLLEILPFLPLRELDLSYNAVAQVCVGGDGG